MSLLAHLINNPLFSLGLSLLAVTLLLFLLKYRRISIEQQRRIDETEETIETLSNELVGLRNRFSTLNLCYCEFEIQQDGRITYIDSNESFKTTFNLSPIHSEINLSSLFKEHESFFIKNAQKLLNSDNAVSETYRHNDSTWFHTHFFKLSAGRIAILLYDISNFKHSEQLLNDKIYRLQQILDFSPMACLILENDKLTDCNSHALQLFTYSDKEALLNAGLNKLLTPHVNIELSFDSNKKIYHERANAITADGQSFPAKLTVRPTSINGRKFTHMIVQDISSQLEREKVKRISEERLRGALEAANLGLWDWNIVTGELYTNDIWKTMLGYPPDDSVGSRAEDFMNLIHPDDIKLVNENIEENMSGKQDKYHVHFRMRQLDGNYIWIHAAGQIIEYTVDGKPLRMIGIHMEISDTIELQEKLLKAKDEAISPDQAKSDFIANMSHELRTPLNAIIGTGYLMEKTELTKKQSEHLRKMQTSANLLFETINEILDFSKISANALHLEKIEFKIEDVLRDVGDVNSDSARSKGLEMLYSFPAASIPPLIGDPLRLSQVLNNLISNAIKFTETGAVVLSYEVLKQTPSEVTINFAVKDTGIGLSKEQQDHLFIAFTQADGSTTRKYGGTGLGLSICQRLIRMMNSEIKVESEPGQGARFSFTVTFATGLHQQEDESHMVMSELRVLVVDDSIEVARVLLKMLSRQVQNTQHASSINECKAMLLAAEKPFDLVLLDRQMPGGDGLDVCRWIKNHKTLKKIPKVVICSGMVEEADELKGHQAGYDGYLNKPFTRSAIFSTIQKVFDHDVDPVLSQPDTKPHKTPEGLAKIRNAAILLVEDNEINQDVATEILEDAGFKITLAKDGHEALKQLKENTFDLVLMDIQMPVMDGYEATRILRSNPAFIDLPILAMTANATERDRKLSELAGMNEHISKPIAPETLFEALIRWIPPKNRFQETATTPVEESPQAQENMDEGQFPIIDGLDIEKGMFRVIGNRSLYLKTAGKFVKNYQFAGNEIRKLLLSQDKESAVRLAHSLKGVAGLIGADTVQKLADKTEKALRHDEDTVDSLLEELEAVLAPLVKQINEKLLV